MKSTTSKQVVFISSMTKTEVLDTWKIEYQEVKEQLMTLGAKADTLEYNLLSAEALRLHECILDLVEMDDAG